MTAEKYTFTENELQEVLGALENQVAAGYAGSLPSTTTTTYSSGEEAPPSSSLKLSKSGNTLLPPTSLSLQFQPHYVDTTTTMFNNISTITTSDDHHQVVRATTTKYNPNHSVVEKQRRDRINSLIEELRELVPHPSGDTILNEKRAKHAVLSDAIHELKDLRRQLDTAQRKIAGCLSTGGVPLSTTTTDAAAAYGYGNTHSATTNTTSSRRSYQEGQDKSPAAPHGVHVEVEEGSDGGGPVVRVSCLDRRGLLADIVRTVRGLSLEIVTASISTTKDGGVLDVFQCRQMNGGGDVDREEICKQLKKCIVSGHIGVKKKRIEEEEDIYNNNTQV